MKLVAIRNTFFPFRKMPDDLSDCTVQGDPARPWLKNIVEPLSDDIPGTAAPLCCYLDTVIFYEQPYRRQQGERALAEYGRVIHRISIDDILRIDGEDFFVTSGSVRWDGCRWVMVHPARKCAPSTIIKEA